MFIHFNRNSFLFIVALGICSAAHAVDGKPFIRQIGGVPAGGSEITPMMGIGAYGAEVGAKFAFRITDNGFVPMINNSVAFEGSLFLADVLDSTWFALAPMLRWNFHLHPKWTVYTSAGLEIQLPIGRDEYGFKRSADTDIDIAIGGIWHFKPDMDLRGEIDAAHSSLRAGVTFRY